MVKKFISLAILFVFVFLLFAMGSTDNFRYRLQTGAVALAGQDEKILTKTFEIKGSQSELSGTSDGSVVNSTFGPSGVLKIRGQGSVNFVPTSSGNGISFGKGGTQNENTAFYLFRGSDVSNIFDYSGGEISFTLKSKYSQNERNSLPVYKYRFPFAIDDNGSQSVGFYVDSVSFIFFFKDSNITQNLTPKDFDNYFGKDKELKVKLVWGNNYCSIYLNGSLYAERNCQTTGQLSSSALLSIGAGKPGSYGGGWWSNDDSMSDFTVSKLSSLDKKGPDISSIFVNESTNSATISWQTNEDSTGDVDYGTLLSYGKSVASSNISKNHSVSITGLLPGTFYNFLIRAKDNSGNISKSTNNTLLTKTMNNFDPILPVVNNANQNNNTQIQISPIVSNTSNKITIKDISGREQVNRVFSISRVFKQGDISSFPQAKISGNTIQTQADVKNRWPDGSVKHSIVSFITSVPANSSVDVEFVNQGSCNCNSGISSTEMLSSKYSLDASFNLTSAGSVNIRDVIRSGNFRYWLSGPIVTEIIAEDRTPSRSFDISFAGSKSFHPIFVATFHPSTSNVEVQFIGENTWVDSLKDIRYSIDLKMDGKSVYTKNDFIHAYGTRWRKSFWKDEPLATHIDHNLAYLASTKAIPNFDTSIKISDIAISDGINKPWNSQCGTLSWVEAVRTGKTDIGGTAQVCPSMPAPGGRPDLGLIPGWFTRFLYGMSSNNPLASKLIEPFLGNAEVSGNIRMHYRESYTDRKFSRAKNDSAFGRSLSLDARPGYILIGPQSDAGQGDAIAFPSTGIERAPFLQPEINHFPALSYVPYLITGDYYFLEEQYMAASYSIGVASKFDGYKVRNKTVNGILGYFTENRGLAWAMREIGQAAFIAPDDSPEKEYFTQIVNNNIAVFEGLYDIKNGNFYNPTCSTNPIDLTKETNPWCYGNKSTTVWSGEIATTPEKLEMVRGNNPLSMTGAGEEAYNLGQPTYKTGKVLSNTAMWMWAYNWNVWGMLSDMGFGFRPVLNSRLNFLLNLIAHPDSVPQIISSYTVPVRGSDGRLFQNIKDLVASIDDVEIQRLKNDNYSNASDGQSGYANISKAAASYLPGVNYGSLKGQDAWNLINNSLSKYKSALEYDQTWAIIPRYSETVQIPVVQENIVSTPINTNPIINIVGPILAPIIENIITPRVETPPVVNVPVVRPTTATPSVQTQVPASAISSLTISSIRATKTESGDVVITWNTNLPSDSNVEYRYSVGSGRWAYNTIFNTNITTSHSVTLKNLKPDSIYYYKVWSKDNSSKTTYSAERIFNTIRN